MEEIMTELILYSPVTGELFDNDYDWNGCDAPLELYGGDLTAFTDSIQEALEREALPLPADRGLMAYYHDRDGVNEKVASLTVTVEERYGKLYGVAECQLTAPLTPAELERLKDYITGQYSDGFGEGFEQRPIQTAEGELYVHLWQDSGFPSAPGRNWRRPDAPRSRNPFTTAVEERHGERANHHRRGSRLRRHENSSLRLSCRAGGI